MGAASNVTDGAVVIAAITSCTNTSNPSVMLAAGLLAKKAVERGLTTHPYVKTSLAPGSRVVTDYLRDAGLTEALDALGFYTVGLWLYNLHRRGDAGSARQWDRAANRALPTDWRREALCARTLMASWASRGRPRRWIRACASVSHSTLQDGRTLVCTPDHKLLCADGRWVRADSWS